jgi:hypothetical protein
VASILWDSTRTRDTAVFLVADCDRTINRRAIALLVSTGRREQVVHHDSFESLIA